MTPRYAVYFVPAAQSALYRFGASLLGYDCYTGTEIAFPQALPVPEPAWREMTQEPRRYGFHATLKAPFHLADGAGEAALIEAFHAFCRSTAAQRPSRPSSPSSKASSRSSRPATSLRSIASRPPASPVSIDFVPRSMRTTASAGWRRA